MKFPLYSSLVVKSPVKKLNSQEIKIPTSISRNFLAKNIKNQNKYVGLGKQ